MPQMAPMMWQTMYVLCVTLLTFSMAKNFFTKVSITSNASISLSGNQENKWAW